MARADKGAALFTLAVLSRVLHDGMLYEEGERLQVAEADARVLVAVGACACDDLPSQPAQPEAAPDQGPAPLAA